MLFRFFKPKWQNQKAEVRLRAVEEISHDAPDSNQILEQLAQTDPDQNVRQAATSRLNNLPLLTEIARKEQNEMIRRSALDRICCLIVDQHVAPIEQRRAALDQLDSPNLLTHVVLKSSDQALQSHALDKITDQHALATIIRSASLAQLRRQAAEKMRDGELIDALIKETLGRDKTVSRILRNTQAELQQAEQEMLAQQQRCEELCSSIEQLANGEYFPQYGAKLNALKQQWEQSADSANHDQISRASAAFSAAEERQRQVLAEQEAQRLAAEQAARLEAEQKAVIEELRRFASELVQNAAQSEQPDVVNTQVLGLLKRRWEDLEETTPELQKRYQREYERCGKLLAATEALISEANNIQQLVQKASDADTLSTAQLEKLIKQCRSKTSDINWPSAENKAAAVRALETSRRALEQNLKQLKQQSQSEFKAFEALLAQLEEVIAQGLSKDADRLQKQAEQTHQRLGNSCPKALERQFRQLTAQVQEMQEWRGFAVSPKKESLCEQMEALIDSGMEPQQLANKIRELQQQWKLLDSTDPVHSHRIWKRFKQAADEAYKPCEQYFNNQKELREKNLLSRHKLCDQLQTYLDAINWDDVNWKELDGLLKQAKREWREHSPVDRSPGKKAQTRFNELLAQLENPLKAYRQENAELKRRLIEEVQALLEQDDLSTATDEVKEIQVRWKEIGPTFRNKEQQLWQQFRELCNDVFDRFHQVRREQSELKSSVSLQVDKICDEMEDALSQFIGLRALESLLDEADAIYNELEEQLSDELAQEFQELQDALEDQRSALLSMVDDQVKALQRKAILCDQLEMALLEGGHEETLGAVYDAWMDNIQLPTKFHDAMENRLQTLVSLAEQDGDALHSCLTEQESRLRQLCIRLEIALGQPSPDEDQALRMEYQMQRLQQALAQQEEALNLKAVKALRCEWLCVPFSNHYPALVQRFEKLLNNLL